MGRKHHSERDVVERELGQTAQSLQRAYRAFDQTADPDLIEAWTFEIRAQKARYAYLLRQRKLLEEGSAE